MGPIIRAAALQPRPWPNGLGITRDITAQNRGDGGFDWLISIADLVENAAFSHFTDCDRIFTLIEGGGVTLTLDGTYAMPCRTLVPASFPGDRPCFCTMGPGSARAFNLFVDRRVVEGRAMVRTLAARHMIRTTAWTQAVFCVSGGLTIASDTLAAGDTALTTGRTIVRTTETSAVALIVEIEPLGPA